MSEESIISLPTTMYHWIGEIYKYKFGWQVIALPSEDFFTTFVLNLFMPLVSYNKVFVVSYKLLVSFFMQEPDTGLIHKLTPDHNIRSDYEELTGGRR